MSGVLTGFAVIGTIIAIGYVVGRLGILGDGARTVLSRIVFFVLSPCLLFTVLAEADVHVLFSEVLLASAIAAVVPMLLHVAVSALVWRRSVGAVTIGALCAGYVNANNIGIPIAVYVLGSAALSAPVLLLQLLVFTPIALTLLDASTRGRVSVRRVLLQPVTNPIIVASLLGVTVALVGLAFPGFALPDPVLEPFRIVGGGAVPLMLIGFGMSLSGSRLLAPGTGRRDILLAVLLKVAVMPVVAFLAGRFLLDLGDAALFGVVVLAALPTAQNVFNYAQRYERGEIVARDSVLLSTVLSVPALVAVAALLAP
ncbi:AEC family transporter [Herbiconiux sp. SYSU D00978]|uniref:AEC family transporter n=1 Tax=Herbiconiux sp. SYSU D00978 TaxID=2812562 RepID=UPI001A977D4F|nr:AEC family transporter [Herbiconiux sp. SYSU D00978]